MGLPSEGPPGRGPFSQYRVETELMGRSAEHRGPTLTMIGYNDASPLTFEALRPDGTYGNRSRRAQRL